MWVAIPWSATLRRLKMSSRVRQFLGFVGYYRRFIPSFADVATPLVTLTGKDVPFVWDSSCSTAFAALHAALMDAPILAFPTETGLYVLDTDTRNFGLGGVLSQVQNNQERMVAYCSRALRPSQRRYCTTKREMQWPCVSSSDLTYVVQDSPFVRITLIWCRSSREKIGRNLWRLQREDPVCITLHSWIVADEFPPWAEVKSMLAVASSQQFVSRRQRYLVAEEKFTEPPLTAIGPQGWPGTAILVLPRFLVWWSLGKDPDPSEIVSSLLLVGYV